MSSSAKMGSWRRSSTLSTSRSGATIRRIESRSFLSLKYRLDGAFVELDEDGILQLLDPVGHLVHQGEVVIHHGVEQGMHQDADTVA